MKTAKRADRRRSTTEGPRSGFWSKPAPIVPEAQPSVDRDVEEALDQGDGARAVAILHERYAARLVRCLTPMCGEAAEDIVQKTFEQALRDIGDFRREVPVRAWVGRIARNRALDHVRAQARSRAVFAPLEELEEDEEHRTPASGVEDSCDERRRLRQLAQALGELKPHVSFAIVLRHIEGFSFPEMVEFCGARAPALERRVARGMNELRIKLARLQQAPRAASAGIRG